MYWRSAGGLISVLLDDGSYRTFRDTWEEGMPTKSCDDQAPEGLWQPIRGFGLLWCRETSVREALGWAKVPEEAFRGVYQAFPRGELLLTPDGTVLILYLDGSWQVLAP